MNVQSRPLLNDHVRVVSRGMAPWRRRRHALLYMWTTLEVSQSAMFWLKLVAPENTAGTQQKN